MNSEQDLDNPEAVLTAHKIFPLKSLGHIRSTKINFIMDTEERHFLQVVKELSREEMWEQLELRRLESLKEKGVMMSAQLLAKARCPKCTLQPPCKHFDNVN